METLPIFMNLRGRRAVIVGGGRIASRKAALIARAGAQMSIVSPAVCDEMQVLIDEHAWHRADKRFSADDLDGACLVIAATDDPGTNRAVYEAATHRHVPINVVDTPELCSFILPAIVDRSPVIVAVSTGGRSPVLARYLKTMLERVLPGRTGRLAEHCGRLRARLHRVVTDSRLRRRYWDRLFESGFAELVFSGRERRALERARKLMAVGGAEDDLRRGEVYLIGAGPGDPELLTIRAQRLLQRADVVLFDRLVPCAILDQCRREAEMIYVGKRHGDHPVPQEEISTMLVAHARRGKRVARLKGGDPFIFGRGGEELQALVEAGIDFEVVPGISAANGAACYAGIPLTHRDHAQGVSFVTGHLRNGDLEHDWSSLVQSGQTLVFFMGATNAEKIARSLIGAGMPPATPVAVVEAATTARQVVHRTALHRLARVTSDLTPGLPSLIVVGSVVNLRGDLGWFDSDGDAADAVFPPHLDARREQTGIGAA